MRDSKYGRRDPKNACVGPEDRLRVRVSAARDLARNATRIVANLRLFSRHPSITATLRRYPETRKVCADDQRPTTDDRTLPMPQPQTLPTPIRSPAPVNGKRMTIHKTALSRIGEERHGLRHVVRRCKAGHWAHAQ